MFYKKIRSIFPGIIFIASVMFIACKGHDMHDSLTEPGTSTNGFAKSDTAMIKDTAAKIDQMPVAIDTTNKIQK